MALTYYSLSELKDLGYKNAQFINVDNSKIDVGEAYNYACTRCGFENPTASDDDYGIKQQWLLRMMQLFFYYKQLAINSGEHDVGSIKLGQVVKNLRERIIDPEERAFEKASESSQTAHIFASASEHFGNMVTSGGIVDDAVGVPYYEE